MEKEKEYCKDCGIELGYRTKDLYTEKYLKTGLCLICFRIKESEEDSESTKFLNIKGYKKIREERRKENGK